MSGEVTVRFAWDKAPGACPEGMSVFFFPESEGGSIWRFDIAGADGGPVKLPVGSYRMLACNNDLRGIRFADTESFGHLCAETREGGGNTVGATGMLYGVTVPYVEVTPCGVTYITEDGERKECGKNVIRCLPDSLATDYRVIVNDVDGIARVRTAKAIVRNVMTGVTICTGMPTGSEVALSMPMQVDAPATRMDGVSSGFACEDTGQKFTLELQVMRQDGVILSKDIDITDQIRNTRGRHCVIIIIDGLDVPEGDIPVNPDEDVGISVEVDGWNVIEVELESRF